MKDVQATGEALSPQKRTSSTSNMKFLHFFLFLWVIFALLDPDPDPKSVQIRIHNTGTGTFGNNLNHSTTHNSDKKKNFLVVAV